MQRSASQPVTSLPIFKFCVERPDLEEELGEIYYNIVSNCHLTPLQVSREFTVQQLLHIWDFKSEETEMRVS
jgi:hypothetical protein